MNKEKNGFDLDNAPIPKRIIDKLKSINSNLEVLLTNAETGYKNQMTMTFRFKVSNGAPKDILEDAERNSFHGFLAKVNSIPQFPGPVIAQNGNKFVLENESLARHIINEFRPIVFNQTDSIFYGKIQNISFPMFNRQSAGEGTKITVYDQTDHDITELFKNEMAGCRSVLDQAANLLDLDYLYNGVLQHADERFHDRRVNDLHTGELSYIFLKNALGLNYIRRFLRPFELVASIFWVPGYPKQGSL